MATATPIKTAAGKMQQFQAGDTIAPALVGSFSTGQHLYYTGSSIAGIRQPEVSQGRLTLTSGTPVTTSDVTGASAQTVYFTPYLGNGIVLYDGSNWNLVTFTEQSIPVQQVQTGTLHSNTSITGLTSTTQLMRGMSVTGSGIPANTTISTIASSTSITINNTATLGTAQSLTFAIPASNNVDIFGVLSGGALTLQYGNFWTNSTTRADAVSMLGGAYVNTSAINAADSNTIAANQGLLLGTIRTQASGQSEDSHLHRLVWNNYNRVDRTLYVVDTTASWTYTSATWREARGQTTNQVDYVCGLLEDSVQATVQGFAGNSGTGGAVLTVAIGVDTTTANSSTTWGGVAYPSVSQPNFAAYTGYPGLGYHYLAWLESSQANGVTTWLGQSGQFVGSGLVARVKA